VLTDCADAPLNADDVHRAIDKHDVQTILTAIEQRCADYPLCDMPTK
jgi:hypothetical protein